MFTPTPRVAASLRDSEPIRACDAITDFAVGSLFVAASQPEMLRNQFNQWRAQMRTRLKRLALVMIPLSVLLAVPISAAAQNNHCGFKGTYAYTGFGYTYEGNALGFPAGNLSINGTITIDGNGNAFVRQAEVINGVLLNAAAEYTGTYTLNPDCTFTAAIGGVPGFVGVVADHGQQVRAMITLPGVQVNFTNTIRVYP
jgi:hypothetical protein